MDKDYYEIGHYNGKLYCINCLPVSNFSQDFKPIFAKDTVTQYPVCSRCERRFTYPKLKDTSY